MSVVVRGMKMPTSCSECEWCGYYGHEEHMCDLTNIRVEYADGLVKRRNDCPLIELSHHGRLVDVEWLKLTIAITLEHLTRNPLMSDKEIMLKSAFKTLELMVDDAPTVIEAWEG